MNRFRHAPGERRNASTRRGIYGYFFCMVFFFLSCCTQVHGRSAENLSKDLSISMAWQAGRLSGSIAVLYGKLTKIEILQGRGQTMDSTFNFDSDEPARLKVSVKNAHVGPGSGATIITVNTRENPFSFFLRDVNKAFPIFIPEYKVAVSSPDDQRSCAEIEREIKSRNLLSNLQKIQREPEASFDSASAHTRNQQCPTWLGLSRDVRIFEISYSLASRPFQEDLIKPLMAANSVKSPELNQEDAVYGFVAGRGQGVAVGVTRRLEDGVLPILHKTLVDEDIRYHTVSFVSLEHSPMTETTVLGSHYLVADYYSWGHTFTREQESAFNSVRQKELDKTEETVLYCRTEATNTGSVPRYAWFKTAKPGAGWGHDYAYTFDRHTGFSIFNSGQVFCVSRLDEKPLPQEEMAILLMPQQTAVFDFFLPHQPVSPQRAHQLAQQSFDLRLTGCKSYWQAKLDQAATIRLPEKRIEEMLQAGLLHLDLITYGLEPNGTLAPCIGVYSPIGTESSPIIQFYNSMGWHDVARRSLMFFLDKQHEDGLIQNFGGYMVETGAALWSMGEYFRYTNDIEWVKQVKIKVLKSCDYLLQWRNRNKIDALRGKGYGMIDGKVADPEDPFHQYMLNGYGYLGISRAAEMLAPVDAAESARLAKEAEEWKTDIRASLFYSMAHSPVIPCGDGTWCPTVPPWTEATGPRSLYIQPETFFSHGTFTVPDVLLGPLYLVFCEILSPEEQAAGMMLKYHSELFYQNNAAFSQPYYSRHNWLQLRLGLIKPFLKTYYSTFSALADRETYTFWEHLYQLSVHKTHEEAWFLMETRWMLYLEDGQTLRLLSGVPRQWFQDGQEIELKNAASYFGPFNLQVNSFADHIDAAIELNSDRKPQRITIRLPHPHGKQPLRVSGGQYEAGTESVTIAPFTGSTSVRVEF
jgi:hypothetical protein